MPATSPVGPVARGNVESRSRAELAQSLSSMEDPRKTPEDIEAVSERPGCRLGDHYDTDDCGEW